MSTTTQAAPKTRVIPSPQINPENKPFWEAAARGEFLIGHCDECGKPHYYPRAVCPLCFSDRTRMSASTGQGAIYSYSVLRRGVPAPYAIAYVRLDEGVTVMTNLVDCDFDALSIGQRVKVAFKPAEDGSPVPVFTPA